MANWASTAYAIEGEQSTLQKIYDAILNGNTDKIWEGDVLKALGIDWEEYKIEHVDGTITESGYYLRGFIENDPWLTDNLLRFSAEEAWGLTDFAQLLKENFHDIKIYWIVEEPGCEVYATNDKKGKYFHERYFVDTCIMDNYQSEYFITEEEIYRWLSKITNGIVRSEKDAEDFNDNHTDSDDFISIHKFDVLDEDAVVK